MRLTRRRILASAGAFGDVRAEHAKLGGVSRAAGIKAE